MTGALTCLIATILLTFLADVTGYMGRTESVMYHIGAFATAIRP